MPKQPKQKPATCWLVMNSSLCENHSDLVAVYTTHEAALAWVAKATQAAVDDPENCIFDAMNDDLYVIESNMDVDPDFVLKSKRKRKRT
jgi:hypothetical protein